MRKENGLARVGGSCPACGYNNAPDEARCEKCGRRLQGLQRFGDRHSNLTVYRTNSAGDSEPRIQPLINHTSEAPQISEERDRKTLPASTRKQLSSRVKAFRARRLNGNLPLQFEEDCPANQEDVRPKSNVVAFETASALASNSKIVPLAQVPPASAISRSPRHAVPRIEQPELNFPFPEEQTEGFLAMPVAPFRLRLLGHACDFGLSLAAFLLFLIPLKFLAGPVVLSRFVLAGIGCAYVLLVLLYGMLFLCLAGATPSMKWLGLYLVNFDGLPPARRQLFCRFLGAIASVGSFFLGFLWAAVDEEKLSWHDRISKTFLTKSARRPSYRGY